MTENSIFYLVFYSTSKFFSICSGILTMFSDYERQTTSISCIEIALDYKILLLDFLGI